MKTPKNIRWTSRNPHAIVCALAKTADFAGNMGDHAVNQRKRFVFAEGHEVNFVVGKNALTLRVKKKALL